ncbi:hypothetical protein [Carboxylicivirga marina]|uniref:CopG family transcriptional regulator n=1 Tax=Carboxylicivirga marina TaxID=2800988 RepID=A0ABS1HM24_9BACT|nr:hypothetical protein [Carboxylicivirga marina]MBK3518725.1 hypothetical protein [Carboxylicivirga marina]
MTKKSFTGGLDLLLQGSKKNIESEKKADKDKKQAKTTKATYYLDSQLLEKTKIIAFFERESISDIITQALNEYVSTYSDMKQAEKQYAKKHQKQ